ncbi:MAG: hypothetical protein WCH85_11085 [Methanomicrobiales archaeon]
MGFNYFDPEERKERRKTVFPQDCKRASELGARLVQAGDKADPQ